MRPDPPTDVGVDFGFQGRPPVGCTEGAKARIAGRRRARPLLAVLRAELTVPSGSRPCGALATVLRMVRCGHDGGLGAKGGGLLASARTCGGSRTLRPGRGPRREPAALRFNTDNGPTDQNVTLGA